MDKSIFKRHELKYLVSAEQREFIESEFARYMIPDEHGESTICNIYYDKEADRIRHKEQDHGRCMCPYRFIWKCDGDCIGCEYHAGGDITSLDQPLPDGNGRQIIITSATEKR